MRGEERRGEERRGEERRGEERRGEERRGEERRGEERRGEERRGEKWKEQCTFLEDAYVKYSSARRCRREFEHRFADVRIPSRSTIHNLVNKVRRTGSFLNKKRVQQRHSIHNGDVDPLLTFFIDEAWIHVHGHVSTQNNRYQATENPHIIHEVSHHAAKVGIRCAVSASRIIGPMYTKQGSLKDHTDCAPNNGYYFLPLYDKGEYILKIEPPAGWSFEPKEVILNVDGTTDQCSQGKDINFIFKGFAITGKVVSSGTNVGPKGIKVSLHPDSDRGSLPFQEVPTSENGDFQFTPVLPGKYLVKASHPRWKLSKNSVTIHLVKENVKIPPNSLVVRGYDVSGLVTSDNEPIKGVSFVLFQAEGVHPVGDIQDCDKSPLKGFKMSGVSPLCHVNSDERGQFVFPSLPPNTYKVVPHYEGPHSIKFDVRPVEVVFTVGHESLKIDTEFKAFDNKVI
ncbi:hypothetical protein ANN_22328 [Periplaneta americana]|uniref:Uncharacterized protein n=1 Tax=Periplaneta americana TaxID=6978 RepID=A0ABQ8S860_PERAM|nr:hypothetical protein ANN_22328 [Periplaneta americana]